jgi:hypothetical protein
MSQNLGRQKGDALDDLHAAFSESCAPGWDGYDAASASYDSYLRTKRLIEALPSNLPAPEVAVRRSQTLHARGDIVAANVSKARVTVAPSEPPPRHANIEGWPAENSAQKLIAIDLADAASLVVKP